ncbi:MAG: tetratricopeptide repeat protein [Pirellulales bacterium]|nr:tetratricopeptide repeat protein [Pirellulales bacterium]
MSTSLKLLPVGIRQTAAVRCGLTLVCLCAAWTVAGRVAAQEATPAANVPATDGIGDVILPPLPEGDAKYPDVEEAKKLFDQGDLDGALEKLKVAKERDPQLSPPRVLLARMAMAQGNINLARTLLELAAEEDPNDPSAYQIIGELAFREGRLLEATMVLDRSTELLAAFDGHDQLKRDLQVHLNSLRAVIAMRRQQWPAAEQLLRDWIELAPDKAVAHFNLAQVLFKQQRYDEALAELEVAAQGSEVFPPADIAMGRLYAGDGNKTEAAASMKRALEKNPQDARTLLGVADWHLLNGDFDEAWPLVQSAVEVDSSSLPAKLMAGTVARFKQDNASAEKFFEQAYLQSPGNFQAADQLALVLIETGDDAKRRRALELAETNARQYPEDPAALATLGWVYFKYNRVADAARVFQALSRTTRIGGDSAFYMANISKQLKRNDDAVKLLQLAVSSDAPFVHRAEAEKMLKDLGGTVPAKKAPASTQGAAAAPQ